MSSWFGTSPKPSVPECPPLGKKLTADQLSNMSLDALNAYKRQMNQLQPYFDDANCKEPPCNFECYSKRVDHAIMDAEKNRVPQRQFVGGRRTRKSRKSKKSKKSRKSRK